MENGLIKASEVARRLNVSEQQVYRMAKRGDLRRIQVGKQWQYREDEIEAIRRGEATKEKAPLC